MTTVTIFRRPYSSAGVLKLYVVGVVLAAYAFVSRSQESQELKDYAQACDTSIGIPVPSFSCSDGVMIPIEGTEGTTCKKPPYLEGAGCYKGSRFKVLAQRDEVRIVALCRHKGRPGNDRYFNDIAVIQTDFESGATCFYQKLGESLDGNNIPAPTTGNFWLPPSKLIEPGTACVECHDSGPFIRTPYLTQVSEIKDSIKIRSGSDGQKYWFPGASDTIGSWNGKVFQLRVKGSTDCSGACHIMGANTVLKSDGTSAYFGPRSTGAEPTAHLVGEFAHWMKPGRSTPNTGDKAASEALKNCAVNPDSGCERKLWPGQELDQRDDSIRHESDY